jgi:hypothetical protein
MSSVSGTGVLSAGSLIPVQAGGGRTIYKPSHQACKETPVLPNYVYIQRTTALPSAWSGSETFTEFEIPQSLGTVDQFIVRFQITIATANVTLPNTSFWVSRVEEYIGNDLLATTFANDQYNETVGFMNTTEVQQMGQLMNIPTTQTSFAIFQPQSLGVGTWFYYLPLTASAFQTMKPCVAGFTSKLRVRLYFPASIIASGSGTLSLGDCTLIARELKNPNLDAVVRAHQKGVVDYNIIVRERQQDQVTLTAAQTTPFYLRSFKNDSAGVLIYVTPQAPTNAQLHQRLSVQDIQLLDQTNNRITEVIREDFNLFMWNDMIESAFPAALGLGDPANAGASQFNHVNIVPFSADFKLTSETGCDYGKYPFTTLEKMQITANTQSAGNVTVNTTSYSYGHVVVREGKHYIQMTSTAGGR